MVQVEKEERGNKGAALTTFISLAGRFLVLMPNNPRAGGVSRRTLRARTAIQMREVMSQLQIPDGMGAIIRTAGVGPPMSRNCNRDLDALRTQSGTRSRRLKGAARRPSWCTGRAMQCTRAMRDYLSDDVGEVLVDDEAAFGEAGIHAALHAG